MSDYRVEQTVVLSLFEDGTWDALLTIHGPDGRTVRASGYVSAEDALRAVERLAMLSE